MNSTPYYGPTVDLTDTSLAGYQPDGDDPFGADPFTPAPRPRFTPNYVPSERTRILRAKLYADEGGVATVTFRGTITTTPIWTATGASGRPSVYAEVTRDAEDAPQLQTTLRLALVPTGKRVPQDGDRIGSEGRTHIYLLDATVGPQPEPEADDADADGTPADEATNF